jgi:peptide/nickel transport system permease protein
VSAASAVVAGEIGLTSAPPAAPWRLAARRLRRNRLATTFSALLLAIVAACLLAPVYAAHIAHTGPDSNHISEVVRVGDHSRNVVSRIGVPIGPTWHSHFLLGADDNGRDEAVRLLYGGRNSLEIGGLATIITMAGAIVLGTIGGFFGGWVDTVISRVLDIVWAYPVLLLGVALGTALAVGGLSIGPWHIESGTDLLPALVIGVVSIPYVARPIRSEVLTLREREFVDAARTLGHGPIRVIVEEILPNLSSILIVFVALQLAQSIVFEAGLSFLGAGVQPPTPSWGTMLADGVDQIFTAPHLTLVPGAMLVATVLAVNVMGDAVRAAFDPRARAHGGR